MVTTITATSTATTVVDAICDERDFYVDATNGDNSKDGRTPATAWKTIGKVNSETFVAGDHIYFKCGETFAGKLAPTDAGELGNPIVFGSYDAGAKPIIDGSGETQGLVITSASYNNLRFEGLDFSGASSNPIYLNNVHDLYFYDCVVRNSGNGVSLASGCALDSTIVSSYNITFDTCVFHTNYSNGFICGINGYDILLTYCTAYNNGHSTSAHHGYYVGGGTTIDHCEAYSNSCAGFKLNDNEIEPSYYPTLRYSYAHENNVGAVITHKNSTLHNNLFWKNTNNLHIYGNTWGGYKIYFNTLVNAVDTIARAIVFAGGASPNSYVKNNIFVNDMTVVTRGIFTTDTAMATLAANYDFDYNIYYTSQGATATTFAYDSTSVGSELKTWNNWKGAGSWETHSTFLALDAPDFVNNYADLHPADGGNLKAASTPGIAIVGYSIDKDGNSRADPPNIGCYEEASA